MRKGTVRRKQNTIKQESLRPAEAAREAKAKDGVVVERKGQQRRTVRRVTGRSASAPGNSQNT